MVWWNQKDLRYNIFYTIDYGTNFDEALWRLGFTRPASRWNLAQSFSHRMIQIIFSDSGPCVVLLLHGIWHRQ
jgi:hypothetical protein